MNKSLLSIFSLALVLAAPAAWSGDINNLRGQRYCEVLLGFKVQKAGPAEKDKKYILWRL